MASNTRGRGRGRGAVQLRQPNDSLEAELTRPGIPNQEEKPLPPSMSSLLKAAMGDLLLGENKAAQAAEKFNSAVATVEDVDCLAELMITACEEDLERARPLAVLCNGLTNCWKQRESTNPTFKNFRGRLLKKFGQHYENRKKIPSFSAFIGFASFLAYLYNKLKINDAPPSFLAAPVSQCLQDLLVEIDGADCFQELFEEIGPQIDKSSPEVMDELCSFCREQLLVAQCPPWKRCVLLQLLELRASNWKLPEGARRQYYSLSDKLRSLSVS